MDELMDIQMHKHADRQTDILTNIGTNVYRNILRDILTEKQKYHPPYNSPKAKGHLCLHPNVRIFQYIKLASYT